MRIVHTGDWHLGRIFHQKPLLKDQRHLLAQVIEWLKEKKPDLLIIAGDIYDRSVPPAEAVKLLDETVKTIVFDLGIRIVMIAGNHDSADRLDFGAEFFERQKMHIIGSPLKATPIHLEDEFGAVDVVAVPYVDPVTARSELHDMEIKSYEEAMAVMIERQRPQLREGARKILVTHAFLVDGKTSESERSLSVGGASAIPAKLFEGFDYVALGHLHRPQEISAAHIRYAGSLMKYSFSEVDSPKSLTLVELGKDGFLDAEKLPLKPKKDLRLIEGHFKKILADAESDDAREDYITILLDDKDIIPDARLRVSEYYPNTLAIKNKEFLRSLEEKKEYSGRIREKSVEEQFADFFEYVTSESLEEEAAKRFNEVYDAILNEREER